MNFIAIDFETANSKRDSICALGAVLVENSKIVKKFYTLIKPHKSRNHFSSICKQIHGINENMVNNSPEFPIVYNKIKEYIENYWVFAHNAASADISMIRKTLELYDINIPDIKYGCSLKLSKNIFELISYRLDVVAKTLDIELDHHNPISDAMACASIILYGYQKYGNKIYDLSTSSNKTCKKIANKKVSNEINKLKKTMIDDLDVNDSKPCFCKKFIFTGKLESMPRKDAKFEVEKRGGNTGGGITYDTNYLVVGDDIFFDYHFDKTKTNKFKKAEEYKQGGKANIQIISEQEFLKMICHDE